VVWIALDPTDDQPVAFWAQVLTALQAAALPAIGKSILPLLESGQPPTEGVLAVVVNELSALGRPPLYLRAVGNPPGAHDSAVVNSSAWRTAEIPAVNGHGTARAVAGFYHALSTGRILSAETLAEATRPQCSGTDQVFGDDNAWGLGFGIDDEGFGMGGLGGSYGGTSTRGGYSLGFVTGSAGSHQRVTSLENSLRTCLALEPLDL
jgi:hypothetical protein